MQTVANSIPKHSFSYCGSASRRRSSATQNPIPAQAIPMIPIVTESDGASDFWYAGAIGVALGSLGVAGALVVVVFLVVVLVVPVFVGEAVATLVDFAVAAFEATVFAETFFVPVATPEPVDGAPMREAAVFLEAVEVSAFVALGTSALVDIGPWELTDISE